MEQLIDFLYDMFPHDVIVEPCTGSNVMGERTYGDPVTWKAMCKGEHKLVRTLSGGEVVSTVTVVFAGNPGASVQDRFTLPSTFRLTRPDAVSVMTASDENGTHHQRAFFL